MYIANVASLRIAKVAMLQAARLRPDQNPTKSEGSFGRGIHSKSMVLRQGPFFDTLQFGHFWSCEILVWSFANPLYMKNRYTVFYCTSWGTWELLGRQPGVGGPAQPRSARQGIPLYIFLISSLYNYYLTGPNKKYTMGLASRIWPIKIIQWHWAAGPANKKLYNGNGQLAQPIKNHTMGMDHSQSCSEPVNYFWTLCFPFAED